MIRDVHLGVEDDIEIDSYHPIGVLENEWLERVTPVGDAALDGARAALVSDGKRAEAEEIAKSAKYVPLSGSAHFEREFIANMNF